MRGTELRAASTLYYVWLEFQYKRITSSTILDGFFIYLQRLLCEVKTSIHEIKFEEHKLTRGNK